MRRPPPRPRFRHLRSLCGADGSRSGVMAVTIAVLVACLCGDGGSSGGGRGDGGSDRTGGRGGDGASCAGGVGGHLGAGIYWSTFPQTDCQQHS